MFRPLVIVSLVAVLVAPLAQAGQLYRYTNAQGRMEIGSSVPNEMVVNGYEVIDSSSGRVLRTVAPQLSKEQIRLKLARQERFAQCRDSQRRVNSLYEIDEDIDHAERQALDSIETRIINAQASLTQLRNQERELEDQAARLERSGHGVNAALVGSIEQAKTQIKNLELEVLGRRIEQDEARKQFDRDREVFRQADCSVVAEQVTLRTMAEEQRVQKRETAKRRAWLDLERPIAE